MEVCCATLYKLGTSAVTCFSPQQKLSGFVDPKYMISEFSRITPVKNFMMFLNYNKFQFLDGKSSVSLLRSTVVFLVFLRHLLGLLQALQLRGIREHTE